MSEEAIAAVHAGLRILAGMDLDGARVRNDAGFNKVDTGVGRALAQMEALTARQAVLGRRLCRRYRRQLPADLLAVALGQETPAAEAALPAAEAPAQDSASDAEAPAAAPVAPPAKDYLAVVGDHLLRGDARPPVLPKVTITAEAASAVHECLRLLAGQQGLDRFDAVSYTHLTLPTILRV